MAARGRNVRAVIALLNAGEFNGPRLVGHKYDQSVRDMIDKQLSAFKECAERRGVDVDVDVDVDVYQAENRVLFPCFRLCENGGQERGVQQRIGGEVEEKVKAEHRKYVLKEEMREVGGVAEEELKKLSVLDDDFWEFKQFPNHSSCPLQDIKLMCLDWMTSLLWVLTCEEELDLARARAVLDENYHVV
ncbi:ATP-dependent protease PIM1 [Echinococcus multilocularis]|uniref:ATP-dependent protease PIM1 n=1 Tax=Echinococcus multilocularis TaxID=6211 RepID=A0A068Y6M3_ECHMU|nr:ATP-dependent protease PIM1 [Echinococcus multilocularis]